MSAVRPQDQQVLEARTREEVEREERPVWRRRVVAGPSGMALLLAGGAAAVRVAVILVSDDGAPVRAWVFTLAACVLAGVALVLVALPKIVPHQGSEQPDSTLTRG
ncbi:MAG TPA: hypothetical protein VKD47_00880 [Miltoncostaeaceae bacterium]|nr:hypothetical protein [Miltoncostaeaceae bacterium]